MKQNCLTFLLLMMFSTPILAEYPGSEEFNAHQVVVDSAIGTVASGISAVFFVAACFARKTETFVAFLAVAGAANAVALITTALWYQVVS